MCALYEEEAEIVDVKAFNPGSVLKRKGNIIFYKDESWYQGDIENEMPNGSGTYTRPDKTYYQGQWRDGVPHGMGKEYMVGRSSKSYRIKKYLMILANIWLDIFIHGCITLLKPGISEYLVKCT